MGAVVAVLHTMSVSLHSNVTLDRRTGAAPVLSDAIPLLKSQARSAQPEFNAPFPAKVITTRFGNDENTDPQTAAVCAPMGVGVRVCALISLLAEGWVCVPV